MTKLNCLEKTTHVLAVAPGLQQVVGFLEMLVAAVALGILFSKLGIEEFIAKCTKQPITKEKMNKHVNTAASYLNLMKTGASHFAPFYGSYFAIQAIRNDCKNRGYIMIDINDETE